MACTELLGPVRFDGFDATGNPVGKPHPSPRIQLCGVSADQADNTMSLVVEMLGNGCAADEYDLDIGITRVLGPDGRLEPVTASVKSREGQRPTFASLDETGLWVPANQGPALAATIRRNLAKIGGRSVESTNMPRLGEESVAEASLDYWNSIVEGRARDPGLLMDCRSASSDTNFADYESCMAGLREAYGDAAAYVDLERIYAELQDPATLPADGKRFYGNLLVKGEDQWIDKTKWDLCTRTVEAIEPGTEITLGFDGSIRDDATALIGCRLRDGLIFPIKIWEAPENARLGEWEVDVLDVDAIVRWAFDQFRVVRMCADPAHWQDILGRWALDLPEVFEWWTNRVGVMSKALERFETAILTGQLLHVGDLTLTRHVLNARVAPTPYGIKIFKDAKGGKRKIDAAVAAVLAWEARAEAIEGGALSAKRNQVWGF